MGLANRNIASFQVVLVSDGPPCSVQETHVQLDGTFRISPVRTGNYRVAVSGLPDGYGIKTMTAAGLDLFFNSVRVVTSTPTQVLIELAPLEEIRRTKSSVVRVGDSLHSSCLIRQIKPVYSSQAKAARVVGNVIMEVRVDKNGYVEDVTVIKGHPLLNQSAVSAVRKWRYAPVVFYGTMVPVVTTVVVPFGSN
jgi:TonB family protein